MYCVVMLTPTVLAEGAPHFLRAVGILPVLFVFPAVGLCSIWDVLRRRMSMRAIGLMTTLIATLCLLTTLHDYFVRHVQSEATYYNFESGATQLAGEINRFLGTGWYPGRTFSVSSDSPTPQRRVYLAEQLWRDWVSLRYLVPDTAGLVLLSDNPPPVEPATDALVVVWPYASYAQYLNLLPRNRLISVRDGLLERGDLEKDTRLLCRVYETGPTTGVPSNIGERLEYEIQLLGYQVSVGDTDTTLRLFWRAGQLLDRDYSVFVHLRQGEQMVTQSDSQPARGNYPTRFWRPGDVIVDEHTLEARTAPDSDYSLQIGMYLLDTMTRLQVLNVDGSAGKGDVVTIPLP
jgi:hypothetical protein